MERKDNIMKYRNQSNLDFLLVRMSMLVFPLSGYDPQRIYEVLIYWFWGSTSLSGGCSCFSRKLRELVIDHSSTRPYVIDAPEKKMRLPHF